MAINNEHENVVYCANGEFQHYGEPQTDAEWREYDAWFPQQMAGWDPKVAEEDEWPWEVFADENEAPPF